MIVLALTEQAVALLKSPSKGLEHPYYYILRLFLVLLKCSSVDRRIEEMTCRKHDWSRIRAALATLSNLPHMLGESWPQELLDKPDGNIFELISEYFKALMLPD